jgi:hypothetical protein
MGNRVANQCVQSEFKRKHLKTALIQMSKFDQRLRKRRKIAESENFSKHIIMALGWPDVVGMGKSAIEAAWLLTMHSPDIDFQRSSLQMLKKLLRFQNYSSHLAYLEDRVLIRSGKPQKYGTQFRSCEYGRWIPEPIARVRTLDVRRRAVGLSTFEQYQNLMRQLFPIQAWRKTASRPALQLKVSPSAAHTNSIGLFVI